MYCTKCGKENNDNSLFCEECGAKLHSIEPTGPSPKRITQLINPLVEKGNVLLKKVIPFFKNIAPKTIGIAAIALVLIVSLCVAVFYKSDEEKILKLTNELAISFNEGDYEKMVACFEPAARNQINASLGIMSSLLGKYTFSFDHEDAWSLGAVTMTQNEKMYISVYDISVSKNTATMDISFSFDEGKNDAIGTVGLTKIKGKWYFKNF